MLHRTMTSWNSGSGDIHGMHIGGGTLGEYSRGETGSYRGREYKGGGDNASGNAYITPKSS